MDSQEFDLDQYLDTRAASWLSCPLNNFWGVLPLC